MFPAEGFQAGGEPGRLGLVGRGEDHHEDELALEPRHGGILQVAAQAVERFGDRGDDAGPVGAGGREKVMRHGRSSKREFPEMISNSAFGPGGALAGQKSYNRETMDAIFVDKLREALGEDQVRTAAAARLLYSYDAAVDKALPGA